jgi:hypothetical protein
MPEQKATDPVQHLNMMFIVYTLILIFGVVEVYQTTALAKLTKALEANSQQNRELIELGNKQLLNLKNLVQSAEEDDKKIQELQKRMDGNH